MRYLEQIINHRNISAITARPAIFANNQFCNDICRLKCFEFFLYSVDGKVCTNQL